MTLTIIKAIETAINGKGYKRTEMLETISKVVGGELTRVQVWSGSTQVIKVNDLYIAITIKKGNIVGIQEYSYNKDKQLLETKNIYKLVKNVWQVNGEILKEEVTEEIEEVTEETEEIEEMVHILIKSDLNITLDYYDIKKSDMEQELLDLKQDDYYKDCRIYVNGRMRLEL